MSERTVAGGVRRAREADRASILRIVRAEPRVTWSDEALGRALATDEGLALVAEVSDRVEGFLLSRRVVDWLEIDWVVVDPRSRGRGLGRRLLVAALREARALELDSVVLEAEEGNLPARRLYESVGFVETGRRPDYYGGGRAAVLLRRSTTESVARGPHRDL